MVQWVKSLQRHQLGQWVKGASVATASAQIQSLAQELLYAAGATKTNKQTNKQTNQQTNQ